MNFRAMLLAAALAAGFSVQADVRVVAAATSAAIPVATVGRAETVFDLTECVGDEVLTDGGRIYIQPRSLALAFEPVGAPQLPVGFVSFSLPSGASVVSVAADAEWDTIAEGIEIAAIPEPVTTDNPIPTGGEISAEYASLPIYPASPVAYSGRSIASGTTRDEVAVYPYRYFPSEHRLERARSLKVSIAYSLPSRIATKSVKAASRSLSEKVDVLVISPPAFMDLWPQYLEYRRSTYPGFVFSLVSTEDIYALYEDAANPVPGRTGYAHKDEALMIHWYIEDFYRNRGTSVVILGAAVPGMKNAFTGRPVNRETEIPFRYTVNCGERAWPSDNYYACMDYLGGAQVWDYDGDGVYMGSGDPDSTVDSFTNGDDATIDWTADLIVSRIPLQPYTINVGKGVTAAEQMAGFVRKLRAVEAGEDGLDFAGRGRNAILGGVYFFGYWPRGTTAGTYLAECLFHDGGLNMFDERHPETTIDCEAYVRERAREYVDRYRAASYMGLSAGLYHPLSTDQICSTPLDFSVIYAHGWERGTDIYDAEYAWTQTGLTKIIDACVPCSTGEMDHGGGNTTNNTTCLGYAPILNPDGGAVASMNNTRVGWWSGLNTLSSRFDQLMLQSLMGADGADATVGEAHLRALQQVRFGSTRHRGGAVILAETLFGDPFVKLAPQCDRTWDSFAATGEPSRTVTATLSGDATLTVPQVGAVVPNRPQSGDHAALQNLVVDAGGADGRALVTVAGPNDLRVQTKAVFTNADVAWEAPGGCGRDGIAFDGAGGTLTAPGDAVRYFGDRFENVAAFRVTGSNVRLDFARSTGGSAGFAPVFDGAGGAYGRGVTNTIQCATESATGVFAADKTVAVANGTLELHASSIGRSTGSVDEAPLFALTNATLIASYNPRWNENLYSRTIEMNSSRIVSATDSNVFGRGLRIVSHGASEIVATGEDGAMRLAGRTIFDVEEGTLVVSPPLADAGDAQIVKTGAGKLVLPDADALARPMELDGGWLVLEAPATLPGGTLTVRSGATLELGSIPLRGVTRLTVEEGARLLLPGATTDGVYSIIEPGNVLDIAEGAIIAERTDPARPIAGVASAEQGTFSSFKRMLRWNAASGMWSASDSDAPWIDGDGNASPYAQGRAVAFPDFAETLASVTVASQVAPASMSFTGAGQTAYLFDGAGISVPALRLAGRVEFMNRLVVNETLTADGAELAVSNATAGAVLATSGAHIAVGSLSTTDGFTLESGVLTLSGAIAGPVTIRGGTTLKVSGSSALALTEAPILDADAANPIVIDVSEAAVSSEGIKVITCGSLVQGDLAKFARSGGAALEIRNGDLYVTTGSVTTGPYERTLDATVSSWTGEAGWTANGSALGGNWEDFKIDPQGTATISVGGAAETDEPRPPEVDRLAGGGTVTVLAKPVAFSWYFRGANSGDWSDPANWRTVLSSAENGATTVSDDGASVSPVPQGTSSNKYSPILLDGDLMAIGRSVSGYKEVTAPSELEGWILSLALTNSVKATISQIHYLNNGAQGSSTIMVDETSKLVISGYGNNYRCIGNHNFYVDSPDGIEFGFPFTPIAAGTYNYYFGPKGSVKYKSLGGTASTHTILSLALEVGDTSLPGRRVAKRRLIAFNSNNHTINTDSVSLTITDDSGNTITPKRNGDAPVTAEDPIGTYRTYVTGDGVYVEYVVPCASAYSLDLTRYVRLSTVNLVGGTGLSLAFRAGANLVTDLLTLSGGEITVDADLGFASVDVADAVVRLNGRGGTGTLTTAAGTVTMLASPWLGAYANSGRLVYGNSGANWDAATFPATGDVDVEAPMDSASSLSWTGGTLRFTGAEAVDSFAGGVSVGAGSTLSVTDGASVTFGGNLVFAGANSKISVSGAGSLLSVGAISSASGVAANTVTIEVKDGGRLEIGGNVTSTGNRQYNLNISDGTLAARSNWSVGGDTLWLDIADGKTLTFDPNGHNITFNCYLDGRGNVTVSNSVPSSGRFIIKTDNFFEGQFRVLSGSVDASASGVPMGFGTTYIGPDGILDLGSQYPQTSSMLTADSCGTLRFTLKDADNVAGKTVAVMALNSGTSYNSNLTVIATTSGGSVAYGSLGTGARYLDGKYPLTFSVDGNYALPIAATLAGDAAWSELDWRDANGLSFPASAWAAGVSSVRIDVPEGVDATLTPDVECSVTTLAFAGAGRATYAPGHPLFNCRTVTGAEMTGILTLKALPTANVTAGPRTVIAVSNTSSAPTLTIPANAIGELAGGVEWNASLVSNNGIYRRDGDRGTVTLSDFVGKCNAFGKATVTGDALENTGAQSSRRLVVEDGDDVTIYAPKYQSYLGFDVRGGDLAIDGDSGWTYFLMGKGQSTADYRMSGGRVTVKVPTDTDSYKMNERDIGFKFGSGDGSVDELRRPCRLTVSGGVFDATATSFNLNAAGSQVVVENGGVFRSGGLFSANYGMGLDEVHGDYDDEGNLINQPYYHSTVFLKSGGTLAFTAPAAARKGNTTYVPLPAGNGIVHAPHIRLDGGAIVAEDDVRIVGSQIVASNATASCSTFAAAAGKTLTVANSMTGDQNILIGTDGYGGTVAFTVRQDATFSGRFVLNGGTLALTANVPDSVPVEGLSGFVTFSLTAEQIASRTCVEVCKEGPAGLADKCVRALDPTGAVVPGLISRTGGVVTFTPVPDTDSIYLVNPCGDDPAARLRVSKGWLETKYPGATPEKFMENGANGLPVWASYLFGLDPTDAVPAFTCDISFGEDGACRVSATRFAVRESHWGTVEVCYRLYVADSLEEGAFAPCGDETASPEFTLPPPVSGRLGTTAPTFARVILRVVVRD